MIFTPPQARAIARGAVTQARRPATQLRCRYRIGHDYAVQPGLGRDAVCRVKILGTRRHPAGEITFRDARAEGYRTTDEWKMAWVRQYDRAWLDEHKVDLVSVFDDTVSIVNWILLKRFKQRHAHRDVWALVFEIADETRYLAHPTARSGDYTNHPARAIDPEECVGADVLDLFAKLAAPASAARRERHRAEADEQRQSKRSGRVIMLRS